MYLSIVERDFDFEMNFPYVLVGIRRSGKSYTLYQIMNELVKKGHMKIILPSLLKELPTQNIILWIPVFWLL